MDIILRGTSTHKKTLVLRSGLDMMQCGVLAERLKICIARESHRIGKRKAASPQ